MNFQKEIQKDRCFEILFLGAVFFLILSWAVIVPFDQGADEQMRYSVAQYIYRHGSLPRGDDPEIRNPIWGISYAFYPVLSYMFSALFMRIVSFFQDSEEALLMAARMVNVLLGTGTAFFVLKIGKQLFKRKSTGRMFAAMVVFLPQNLFIFCYVNNDGLALFATAIIIYVWAKSLTEGWTWKNCIELGVGIGLLALSYFNAYGWALCSILFFTATMLWCQDGKADGKEWLKKGLLIAGVVFLIAGWWFIRNFILYDGDFLGRATSSLCGTLYAQEAYKPGNTFNGEKLGQGLLGMFFYQAWEHNWIVTVAVSFVGLFGRMDVYMPYGWTKLYFLAFAIGIAAVLVNLGKVFSLRTAAVWTEEKALPDGKVRGTIRITGKRLQKKAVFHWCMAIGMVIPFILLCQYSYSSDMQAQGRYILPMAVPFLYFITSGYEFLLEHFLKKEQIKEILYYLGMAALFLSAVLVTVRVLAPAY